MNPLESTRNTPFNLTIRDCLVGAWIARDGDSASAPTNGTSAGTWTIDVGGHEHRGPTFDVSRHATSDSVKEMLRHWAKEHPNLFD